MVDEDRVLRLLDRIRSDVDALAEQAADPPPAGDLRLGGVKYLFLTAIEGCTRVAHHIGSAEGWPAAETNGDAVRELGRRGVLDPATAEAIGSAVGFRNLLVHQYADVDDERVVAHLHDLGDLRAFVAGVARWVAQSPTDR